MTDALHALLNARFRASPLFALVAHRDLAPGERAAFAALEGRGDYFGLLMPDTALPLSTKTVGHDTAALLRELQQPGPLPGVLRDSASPAQWQGLLQLIIDGILEIETADGFVCGPRAAGLLPPLAVLPSAPGSVLQQLSLQALHAAAAGPELPPLALSSRLYRHHTVPLTPAWQQRWAGVADTREALGLHPGTALGALLFEHCDEVPHAAWHLWRREDLAKRDEPVLLPIKLYVSLHPEALAPGLRLAIETLVRAGAPAFKLARGSAGLLRPDKLIAYVESAAQRDALATRLVPALRGLRAQGVPFTCALTDDGMLSWGSDPPDGHRQLDWQRVESWRSWITRRLAFALVQARGSGATPAECVDFALERLRLAQVDTHTWSPTADAWREE